MTGRLAVGSVSTLAMGALLLGSASFLLNQPGSVSHAAPWGNIASLSNSAAEVRADDKAQLLKMATLTAGATTQAGAAAASAIPVASPTVVATADVAPAVPVNPPTPIPAVAEPAAQVAAPQVAAPVQLAAAEDAAPAATPSDADAAPATKSGLIDLNTASADALDRAGAGHIGRTIVAHRPYRSVKDLVSRRVLRTSDYQKIASRVGVN